MVLEIEEFVGRVGFVPAQSVREIGENLGLQCAQAIALLAGLDIEGICASSGSACSAGSLEPSHVISALGVDKKMANSLVRFSLGRASMPAEVEFVESVLPGIIHRAQLHQQPSNPL